MTEKKYNKILKLLNKAYDLLRSEEQKHKQEAYSNVKCKLKRAIDDLRENSWYWSEK